MKKYRSFLSENFQFLEMKRSIYLNRRVFVMRLATAILKSLLTNVWLKRFYVKIAIDRRLEIWLFIV